MPRILSDDINILIVQDNISGSELGLLYRMPTPQERIAYSNSTIQRRGRNVEMRIGEARQKFGIKILVGIREGDFVKKEGKKHVPLSSDPESKHYDPDWKKHMQAHAADLIEILCARVFDVSAEVLEGEESEGDTPLDMLEEDNAEKN